MNDTDLEREGFLSPGTTTDAVRQLLHGPGEDGEEPLPWIAKILLGIGGWVSAIFLVGFVVTALFQAISPSDESILIGIGLVFLAGSVLLSRVRQHPFLNQLTLALNTAGLIMVIIGGWDSGESFSLMMVIALCPAIYHTSKNSMQKFSAMLAIWATTFACYLDRSQDINLEIAILLALVTVLYLLSGAVRLTYWLPAVYGCLGGLFLLLYPEFEYLSRVDEKAIVASPILSIGIGLGFPVAIGFLTRLPGKSLVYLVVLGIVLGGLGWFGGAGVAISIGLLVIGKARNNRIIETVAMVALIASMIAYYYFLGESLLNKSYIMMGSGVVLLVMSLAARKFNQPIKSSQS